MIEPYFAKRKLLEALRELETEADVFGAEAGLHGLSSDAFEHLACSKLKHLGETVTGPGPKPARLCEQMNQLRSQAQSVEGALRIVHESWRDSERVRTDAGMGWRRLIAFCILAALAGLALRLAGANDRWEIWAILALVGFLAGLGPWAVEARLKRSLVRAAELGRYVANIVLALRLRAKISSHESELRRRMNRDDNISEWRESALQVTMSRFRMQQLRGGLAAKCPAAEEE